MLNVIRFKRNIIQSCLPNFLGVNDPRNQSYIDYPVRVMPGTMYYKCIGGISKDCFCIDDRYGRVLYMQDYASYVKDDMISELCDLSRDLMLSIDILPVPTDEAVRFLSY